MRQEDSLFEQIMKINRTRLFKEKRLHKQAPTSIREASRDLNELDIRYTRLVKEAKNRSIPLERVLEIRKELSEIRRLKRDRDDIDR